MKTLACVKYGSIKDPNESTRGQVAVCDFPEQTLGEHDVKVRIAYCAICGSDPHIIGGAIGTSVLPKGLGHEVSGVVEAVGEKAAIKGLKVGDRVACNFLHFDNTCYYCQNGQQQFCEHAKSYSHPGMAEYVVWHEDMMYKLPDSVDLKKGCLLEPVSVAVRMVDKMHMKVGQRVAICGGGPIGLLVLQLVKRFGATELTMIEPIAERRELAKRFGAKHTIDPAKQNVVEEGNKITNGYGFDVVLDASGFPGALEALLDIAAKGGTVIYGAMYPTQYALPLNLNDYLYNKELTLTGSYISPYAFPRALQLLEELDLEPFTEAVFPIDRGAEAFAAQAKGFYPKILIECNPGMKLE